MMAGRNLLVRGIMLGQKESPRMKSPVNMSPISNLSFHLQHAKISIGTPKRKLNLSSNSPSPCQIMEDLSPLQYFGRDKENFQSPDFSRPSKERRLYTNPLKDLQNISNRSFNFNPSQKITLTPPEKSDKCSVDEPVDQNSENCGNKTINLSLSSPSTLITLPPSKSIISSTPVSSLSARTLSSLAMCTDEYIFPMDLLNEESSSDQNQPKGFSNLLSAPIKCTAITQKERKAPHRFQRHLGFRRISSKMDFSSTPTSSNDFSVITSKVTNTFKRPQAPSKPSQMVDCKRIRYEACSPLQTAITTVPATKCNFPYKATALSQRAVTINVNSPQNANLKFGKSHSESQVSIMKAVSRSVNVSEKLTGDFSRSVALPTTNSGKHPDLTCLTHDTLADLIKGRYSDKVNSYKILDCRYPYEYNGGHIKDAESWNNPQMVLNHLESQKAVPMIPSDHQKRDILIFHCEFSANRGPRAQRLLREKDRTGSKNYPALHYPEIYLLEGGYKIFYQNYPELCTPEGYTSMLDIKHVHDLKYFRAKSKSWACESRKSSKKGQTRRVGLRF